MLVRQHVPNQKTYHYTDAVATWEMLGINTSTGVVTGYASYDLLKASGDAIFPGLDFNFPVESVLVKSENGAGADGSAFYYATNRKTVPGDDDSVLISGLGQGVSLPTVWALWLRKTVATDEIMLSIAF